MKDIGFPFAPEKVFLIFGIVYGILFLLIIPPFQIPDEPNHFYRAYQISEGRLVAVKKLPPVLNKDQMAERDKAAREIQNVLAKGDAETVQRVLQSLRDTGGIGGLLPESLTTTTNSFLHLLHPGNKQNVRDLVPLLSLPLDRDKRVFTHFPNTALYSAVPYLPQAFGIALGRIPHFSALELMYLGRIVNLFIWIFLVCIAIKVTPVCKWLFFLLALMPMSLFQSASLSADSFTNGISFLLISVFLRNAFDRTPGLRFNTVAIFTISLLLSLSKQAYFPILLLFLLIPAEKIGTKKKFYTTFFLLCLLNIGAILLWTCTANLHKDIYILYNSIIPTLSAERQTLYVLFHPLEYCRTLCMTFVQNGRLLTDSFVGQLGWFDTGLPEIFRISYIFMLFVAVLSDIREGITVSLKQRSIIFTTLFLSVIVLSTLAFIGWTPVGSKIIGLQGRYFIPLSPLFFILFYNSRIRLHIGGNVVRLCIICYAFFSLVLTTYVIVRRYYIA